MTNATKTILALAVVALASIAVFTLGTTKTKPDPSPATQAEATEDSTLETAMHDAGVPAESEQPAAASEQSGDLHQPDENYSAALTEVVERIGRPPGPLSKTIADLKSKARNGDTASAYALYKGLNACDTAPRTREEFDQQRHEMSVSFTNRQDKPVDDISKPLADLQSAFRYCEGISHSQVQEAAYWLWYAAENGSLEAKTFFLGSRIPAPDSAAVKEVWIDESARASLGAAYVKEAANAGVANAMAIYALQLLDGHVVAKEPSEAAALLLAVSRLYGDTGDPAGFRQKAARMTLNELPAYEIEKAEQRAEEILSAENCCLAFK